MLHRVSRLDSGLKGECKAHEGHGVSLKTSFALSTAAAFSIQTAKPRANVRQDSKGTEQSAQAGGAGSAEGLCGLRDPAGPQELVPVTGGDSHVTEQLTVPGSAWLGHLGLGWADNCMYFSHASSLRPSSRVQP